MSCGVYNGTEGGREAEQDTEVVPSVSNTNPPAVLFATSSVRKKRALYKTQERVLENVNRMNVGICVIILIRKRD